MVGLFQLSTLQQGAPDEFRPTFWKTNRSSFNITIAKFWHIQNWKIKSINAHLWNITVSRWKPPGTTGLTKIDHLSAKIPSNFVRRSQPSTNSNSGRVKPLCHLKASGKMPLYFKARKKKCFYIRFVPPSWKFPAVSTCYLCS